MRIFVAGSNGQVALSLKEAAEQQGLDLCTAGRPGFDLTSLNLKALKETITAYAPTAIVNAAAYTAVDAAESDQAAATILNSDAAGMLSEIADGLKIPLVHLSTDYVFDGAKEGPYTEADTVHPASIYGYSKLAGEIAVRAEYTDAIILRTAWVYSPFGKNFLKTMLALAKTKDTISVVADQIGNPTYAPDIAAAILHMLSHIAKTGLQPDHTGIFHLAGAGSTSWHGFASAIFAEAGKYSHPVPKVNAISTAEYPTPAKRPANSQLDCSKFNTVFAYQMPDWHISTAACVKRLLE